MIACCASKRSLLTKLQVGIVKENDQLLDQTDFYGIVSPFVAFYRWSGLLRGPVRLSIFNKQFGDFLHNFSKGFVQKDVNPC